MTDQSEHGFVGGSFPSDFNQDPLNPEEIAALLAGVEEEGARLAYQSLVLRPCLHHPHRWRLASPFRYTDAQHGPITVLPGALTDGASIPRALWSLLGSPLRDWRVTKAAVIHDQLYKSLGAGRLSRKDCDAIFYRQLRDNGVHFIKARTYWSGVRAGGWIGWRRYARDPDQVARETALIDIQAPPNPTS